MTKLFAALMLSSLALAAGGFGCTAKTDDATASATAPNSPKPVTSAPTGTPRSTDSVRLKNGPAPLTYMLGPGGKIRVVDLDTGKTVATATAPLQAVITVDPAKGISVSNTVVTPGPLPAGHRYELWLDTK